MICLYDGTFPGLLTLIFDFYHDLDSIDISPDTGQASLFQTTRVVTDMAKAQRVEEALKAKFSSKLYFDIYRVFKSYHQDKDKAIARLIKGLYKYGETYLGSSDKYPILFREMLKNYSAESHAYKGLLRFREIQEGFLYAEMEPRNDILEVLTKHFLGRFSGEKFLIYDKTRKLASMNIYGQSEIVEVVGVDPQDTDEEKIFKEAWKLFYDSIAIGERKNTRLMVSNMPKKYWKYLPEKTGDYRKMDQ